MAYAKDLPGNLGNTDILRAIYDKVGEIEPSPASTDKIELKLDTLIGLNSEINNNIILNTEALNNNTKSISDAIDRQTQAIKDVSININVESKIDVDTLEIVKSIDNFNTQLNNTLSKMTPSPPGPGPHPHPQPHPHPRPPKPHPRPVHHYRHTTSLSTNYYLHYYGMNQEYYNHCIDYDEDDKNKKQNKPHYVPREAMPIVMDVYNSLIYGF